MLLWSYNARKFIKYWLPPNYQGVISLANKKNPLNLVKNYVMNVTHCIFSRSFKFKHILIKRTNLTKICGTIQLGSARLCINWKIFARERIGKCQYITVFLIQGQNMGGNWCSQTEFGKVLELERREQSLEMYKTCCSCNARLEREIYIPVLRNVKFLLKLEYSLSTVACS